MAYKFNFETITITHKIHRQKFNKEYPESIKGMLYNDWSKQKRKSKCRNIISCCEAPCYKLLINLKSHTQIQLKLILNPTNAFHFQLQKIILNRRWRNTQEQMGRRVRFEEGIGSRAFVGEVELKTKPSSSPENLSTKVGE